MFQTKSRVCKDLRKKMKRKKEKEKKCFSCPTYRDATTVNCQSPEPALLLAFAFSSETVGKQES